jgi:hypothetical protein
VALGLLREPSLDTKDQESIMLWTFAVVLAVLWVLGVVTSYTLGGLIHILLMLAVLSLAFQLLRGRNRTA